MLRLTRPDETPSILQPQSVRRRRAHDHLAAIIGDGRSPSGRDFTRLWSDDAVKDRLQEMHGDRCCYCERLRDPPRETDVEHFRPKGAVAVEDEDGGTGTLLPGYWWLAYEWSNLLLACKTCNQSYKKTRFPVAGPRATGPDDDLDAEEQWLLDPVLDDIDAAVRFDWESEDGLVWVHGVGADAARVKKTVDIVGLNRQRLLEERWDALRLLKTVERNVKSAAVAGHSGADAHEDAAIIRELTSRRRDGPFVGMARRYFRDVGLGEYVTDD